MNPLPFILLAITLPLLLGGCGEKGVIFDELEKREGIYYFKDTPYTGKTYELYEDGQKRSEGNFKDGKMDGLCMWWHENGQKAREANYKDDKPDGLWTEWYENGQKKVEVNFKDVKPDGLWTEWHENGQKQFEENFKDGELISAKYWNSKGEPVDSEEEANK
ncbi:toxin-antitoxin system YwqK family antitoxin [Verrucomicrobiales bacterium]|nr:toxin-antitoxin system YwqK family antitoxin [Verrucomicrobiales bacterium]